MDKAIQRSWREIEPGHWTRAMTGMESYFCLIGSITQKMYKNRDDLRVWSIVKIESHSGDLREDAIRAAWVRLRFEQPGLAARTDTDDWTLHYSTPTDDEINRWADSTFFVRKDVSAKELYSDLTDHGSDAVLYWLPSTAELIIRAPHFKLDAIGTWLLWELLLRHIQEDQSTSKLDWGSEVSRLARSAEDVWFNDDPVSTSAIQEAGKVLNTWAMQTPGIGPVSRIGTLAPEKCKFSTLTFSEEASAKLFTACKTQEITITTALHAAFILTNQRLSDPAKSDRKYVSFGSFDLRRYLGPSYSGTSHAGNQYVAALPIIISPPLGDFKRVCRELKDCYQGYQNSYRLDEPNHARQVNSTVVQLLFNEIVKPDFQPGPMSTDALLSSIGVAERYFDRRQGKLEVVQLTNGMDVVAGVSLCSVWTFGGILQMSYCFNEAFQDRESVEEIMEMVKDIVCREMGAE